ncbi:leucine-rich repeat domain-containing protein [Leptospira interrogans]|uniref:leucine-rich repeat domain-containing protein n=1 Tax=Leptospira interrogans TaxID=173 RepID=UPI003D0098AD
MNFQSINIRLNKRLMILLILICFSCKLQAQSNEAQTYYRNITEVLKNPQNVRILNLSGSKLTTLPGEIGKLQNLQLLNLDDNQLIALPKEIGQLQNLESLDLEHNQLNALPKEIGKLQKLQTLNLKYNQLATLPEESKQLKNLKKLYLHNNPLPSEKIERIRKLLPNVLFILNENQIGEFYETEFNTTTLFSKSGNPFFNNCMFPYAIPCGRRSHNERRSLYKFNRGS